MRKSLIIVFALLSIVTISAEERLPLYLDEQASVDDRIEDALKRMTLDEKIAMCHAQSKFSTPGCPRLGIPEIWFSDGPHGVRMEFVWDDWTHANWTNDSSTAMPALTCLASTFNRELAFQYGNVVGEEARYRKKDVILGPGVNIYRTPFSGRNFEYMGEDPLLASEMVVPYIKGVQRNGVAACIKHFALNNQEKWRNSVNVNLSERALNEIYLPAFKAGVEKGGVWAVMGSYNKFKNQYCSHNDTLVNSILKRQWKFNGVMITDWGSAHDTRESALFGLDMEMGTWTNGLTWGVSSAYDNYYMATPLKKMILSGSIPESVLDEKIRRILRLNFRTNMNRKRPYGSLNTKEHAEIARKVAEEGIVLMKNDNGLLPLIPGKYQKIAVIGENAVKNLAEGGGSSELKPKTMISPLEGLRAVYGDAVKFSLGYASGKPDYSRELPSGYDADSLKREAVKLAAESDIVIYIGGLNKNFTQDCEGDDRRFFNLPFRQDELLAEISKANKNIVVVLCTGNAVEMKWLDKVKALVCTWYPGSFGGAALANVISGKVNPSGKLPFSFPARIEDCPAHYFGEKSYPGIDDQVTYMEDIFVGYRWYDSRKIKPLFPFGFGLSYANFKYGKVNTDKSVYEKTDTIIATVEIQNIGKTDGAETVQFYASQSKPSVQRPAKELKAFDKVFLNAGGKRFATVRIPVASLAFFDEKNREWKVESDTFTIHAASSSAKIESSVKIKIK